VIFFLGKKRLEMLGQASILEFLTGFWFFYCRRLLNSSMASCVTTKGKASFVKSQCLGIPFFLHQAEFNSPASLRDLPANTTSVVMSSSEGR